MAQVEQDLDAHIDEPIPQTGVDTPPDALRLRNLKLPSEVPLRIPEGAEISPDLSKLTLPEDLDLTLPEGFDLSDLQLDLPENFDFQLPEGSFLTPDGLQLPHGGSIRLPDGTSLDLPAGTNLDLPRELIDQLLRQGVPLGQLPRDFDVPLRDLPPDLRATLDPPPMTGGGSLRLPKGTRIQLPEGHRFPAEAGALAYALQYLLPAGTVFDLPAGGGASTGGTSGPYPFPQPNAPTDADETGARGVPVDTEITDMPSRVRKGEAFEVGGYVRERATGRPVAGAPVDVFLNETKSTPGELVGSGTSDANGRFRATLWLPTDRPASNYQLVNRANAFTASDGVLYDEGWGDPPLATFASTSLSLAAPARAGVGAQVILRGNLTDDTGLPVAGAAIRVVVDGNLAAVVGTDETGAYALPYVFRAAGEHTITAAFEGSEHHDASAAPALEVLVDEGLALELPAWITAYRGEEVAIAGRALLGGSAAPDVRVDVTLPWTSLALTTGADGRFSTSVTVPRDVAPGTGYRATYVAPDHGVGQDQPLEVRAQGVLRLAASPLADLATGPAITVKLDDDAGAPLHAQPILVTLTGPGGTVQLTQLTAAGTVQTTLAPATAVPGTYTVTARIPTGSSIVASPTSTTTRLGEVEVAWEIPRQILRNGALAVDARVTLAGEPLADQVVGLDLLGPRLATTDGDGHARFSLDTGGDAPLGRTKATLAIAALRYVETREVDIVAQPRVEITAPDAYTPGELLALTFVVRDDNGAALPGRAATLALDAGTWTGRDTLQTTADGSVTWTTTVSDAASGEMVVRLSMPASGPYLDAEGTRTLRIESARVAERGVSAWILPALGLALVGAAGGGIYVFQKRRNAPAALAADLVPVVAPVVAKPAPDLELALAIPPGEPAVWGIGEPLALTLRALTPAREGEAVHLEGPSVPREIRLDAGGRAALRFAHDEEGEIVLRARRSGSAALAEARLRLVDYRKEVAREFDILLERARLVEPRLDRRATVRETQILLGARLDAAAEAPLEEVARIVEDTNYGTAPVSRRHYLRFLDAARRLEPLLAPDDAGGA